MARRLADRDRDLRLGDVYHCTIYNVDPGARFARADGSTREEAERKALEKADALSRTDAPVSDVDASLARPWRSRPR